jgi:hypothetical protein
VFAFLACTNAPAKGEPLTVPSRDLRYLLQFYLVNARQLLVDSHEVIGLAPGLRELSLQELIKRTDVLDPPVLSRSNLAQIATELTGCVGLCEEVPRA